MHRKPKKRTLSNECFNSIFYVLYLFRASWVHHKTACGIYDICLKCQYVVLLITKRNPITILDSVWGFQEAEAFRFQENRHLKVVRLSALRTGRLCPHEIFLVLITVRGWVNSKATVLPEGLCQWKIPVTPSVMEPATFWFVAQCRNQLSHHVPIVNRSSTIIVINYQ